MSLQILLLLSHRIFVKILTLEYLKGGKQKEGKKAIVRLLHKLGPFVGSLSAFYISTCEPLLCIARCAFAQSGEWFW